jgi:hypothetical protein
VQEGIDVSDTRSKRRYESGEILIHCQCLKSALSGHWRSPLLCLF